MGSQYEKYIVKEVFHSRGFGCATLRTSVEEQVAFNETTKNKLILSLETCSN